MLILVLGLVLFFGLHLLPSTSLKPMLLASLGEAKYKSGFSVIALLGLGLIIYGFQLSSFEPLWTPLSWGRQLAFIVMPVAVVLMSLADAPNNLKHVIGHPMLIGTLIWGLSHLAANGDLASTLIFSSFAAFAAFKLIVVNLTKDTKEVNPVSKKWDAGIVIGGLVLYGVLIYFHGSFTGMPLI